MSMAPRPIVTAAVALLLVVAACGDQPSAGTTATTEPPESTTITFQDGSPDSALATLGACPDDPGPSHGSLIYERLESVPAWYETSAADIVNAVDPDSAEVTVALVLTPADLTPLGGHLDEDDKILHVYAPVLDRLTDIDATLLLGARYSVGLDAAFAEVVAAEGADGTLYFVGPCELEILTRPFDAYLATIDTPSPRDALIATATDPDTIQALIDLMTPTEPTPWKDQDPALRAIDPDTTPESVLADLSRIDVELTIPESWRTFPAVVCTRIALGWNECGALDALDANDPSLLMSAYIAPGQPLQVWLLDSHADVAAPLAYLGETANAVDGAELVIELQGTYGSLDEAIEAANDGETPLVSFNVDS